MTRNPVGDNEPFSAAYWSSILNAHDFEYVDNGLIISKGTGNFEIDYTVGAAYNGTDYVTITSPGTITLTNADPSNPRVDLITVDPSAGTVQDITGTAATDPVAPDIPSGETLLGVVYVPGGATSISTSDIYDYRAIGDTGVITQSTEPDYAPELFWIDPDDGIVYVGYDGGNGGDYYPIPAVLKTEEITTFQESNALIDSGNGGIDNESLTSSGIFNISSPTFDTNSSFSGQDSNSRGAVVGDSGTKLFVVGASTESLIEYSLSTPWSLGTTSFVQTITLSAQTTNPQAVDFRDDGTKMYFVTEDNSQLLEYDLNTAWDITDRTFIQSKSITSETSNPQGGAISATGEHFYVSDTANDRILQYSLSTPWDISTASYVSSYDVSNDVTSHIDLDIRNNGFQIAVLGNSTTNVVKYNLKNQWDVTSAVEDSTFDTSGQNTGPLGLFFRQNGPDMYIVDTNSEEVDQWSLTGTLPVNATVQFDALPKFITYWDRASYQKTLNGGTATIDLMQPTRKGDTFDTSSVSPFPAGLQFQDDGTSVFILNETNAKVDEYDLSTAWDTSTATFSQSLDVSGQDTTPRGLDFRPNGQELYFIGDQNDNIYYYDLSTAWDLSSASYTNGQDVSPRTTDPYGIQWKTDGTAFYILDNGGNTVIEYTTSAWDFTTKTFNTKVADNGWSTPKVRDITVQPDGSTFYIALSNGTIHEWTLSTPWDLSTRTLTDVFDVSNTGSAPEAIAVGDSGSKFYIGDPGLSELNQWDMGGTYDFQGALATDISNNRDISDVSVNTNIFWRINLTGTIGSSEPTVDFLARRYGGH